MLPFHQCRGVLQAPKRGLVDRARPINVHRVQAHRLDDPAVNVGDGDHREAIGRAVIGGPKRQVGQRSGSSR
jgi:hypothetical protein